MRPRDWRLRIADMLDGAETAISLVQGLERDAFLGDRVLVDPAIKNVTVVGEAATHVPDHVAARWPAACIPSDLREGAGRLAT